MHRAQTPHADSIMTDHLSPQVGQMRLSSVEAIFSRYTLELDETEYDRRPQMPSERVHKNIRMRVRYTCHNCSTTFGRDRVCVGCQHRRCTRCSRYPPKRDRPKVSQDTIVNPPLQTQTCVLRPNADGGTCHECQNNFEVDVEECPNCHHRICERCTHDASITVEPDQTIQPHLTQGPTSETDIPHRATSQGESAAVS
jgi:hypothetical protein